MPPADIYFNAALINIKLAQYDNALKLIEMASQHGGNDKKYQQLKQRIIDSMPDQAID